MASPGAEQRRRATGPEALNAVVDELARVNEELARTPDSAREERTRLRTDQQRLRAEAAELRKVNWPEEPPPPTPDSAPRERPESRADQQRLGGEAAESRRIHRPEERPPSPPSGRRRQVARERPASSVPKTLMMGSLIALIVGLLVVMSSDYPSSWKAIVGYALMAAWFGFWLYFLPALVAFERKGDNRGAVLIINIFFGWTVIGWIIALAMAYSTPKPWGIAAAQPSTQPGRPGNRRLSGPSVGSMAAVVPASGAKAWTSSTRTQRAGTLPRGQRVRVTVRYGTMVKVLTPTGEHLWVEGGDVEAAPPPVKPADYRVAREAGAPAWDNVGRQGDPVATLSLATPIRVLDDTALYTWLVEAGGKRYWVEWDALEPRGE